MSDPTTRPDPDALLRRIHAEERRSARGKLKVFFGFAPGVGKTYAMLESARRLQSDGVDVVVGLIDTHGRPETEMLLSGLEQLPRKEVAYHGIRVAEFDLDAALARKPRVLLVDELAHTNVAGLRNAKRHQDIEEILEAGIDVHTTLNVQHIESLNDVVAQVTAVRVRETVPDAVLDRAAEVELVDLPPDELLERLREGKVYLGEQASHAAEHFFRRGNLLALRELALRRTADRVDADVQAYRLEHRIEKTWPAAERILVCVSASPSSARLVRAARRMSAGLRAPWVAVSVEPISAAPLSRPDRERLDQHLRLAESLGGTVVRLTGVRTSDVLLEYARKHNVTRIILGKPTHPRLRDRLRGSLLDEVVRGSGDIDVHVISGDESTLPSDQVPARHAVERKAGYAWAAALVGATTAAAVLGRGVVAAPDVVMLFLLVIMIAAFRFGRGPSLLASALSVAAYDFFFVPPFHTFAVLDQRHLLTFAMMFGVGIAISGLTGRIRAQETNALSREARTAALYALSRDLGGAMDERQAAAILVRHVADARLGRVSVLCPTGEGLLVQLAGTHTVELGAAEASVARWVLDHGRPAGRGTETLSGSSVTCFPLRATSSELGVLVLAAEGEPSPTGDERDFLEALARQGAMSIERWRLAEEAKGAALRAKAEEMRSSLLSTVSHDLRTPLAAITGAASTLRDTGPDLGASDRQGLLEAICEEAERLERLVGNLLDMTRLESGGIRLKRDWVPLDEIVGGALTRLEPRLAGRPINTRIADDVGLVFVDPVLLQQVFVNLLENAVKYAPGDSPVDIRAQRAGDAVEIQVGDRGTGIVPGDEERIFDKFYRGAGTPTQGVGLGLAICRGIMHAHGGSIRAERREGGGSLFRLVLPPGGKPPSMPESPEQGDGEVP